MSQNALEVSKVPLIEFVKNKLPYGKPFSIYNKHGLVGTYTSNSNFQIRGNSVIMNTTKMFDEWKSCVTVYDENGFNSGIK
jgi:hypothetical protein